MSRKALRILLAISVGLVLLMFVLQNNAPNDTVDKARQFLPELKSQANDVAEIRVSGSDENGSVTISREAEKWIVVERDKYAADVGKLRQLMIALTDARIVEEKTSNPESYSKLGVTGPEDGGGGTTVDIDGPEFSYSIVLGNEAQGEFRYVRLLDQPTSYLIDRSPETPASAGEWLLPDIVDIRAERIRKVSITHTDGETLAIEKSARDLTDFTVLGIPEGRELSYATVGNGIAGALGTLTLEDVRAKADAQTASIVVFDTWDGLTVTAEVFAEDDTYWVAFEAIAVPDETAEENATGNQAETETNEINERVSGWHYRIPEYKSNLLTRRWEDILKAENGD